MYEKKCNQFNVKYVTFKLIRNGKRKALLIDLPNDITVKKRKRGRKE
jgi:hypothetical protein